MNPSHFDLVVDSFAPGAKAHFTGLVDEVRLFSRALSIAEIRICRQASAQPGAVPDDPSSPERKRRDSGLSP